MYEQVEKPKENKSRSVYNSIVQRKSQSNNNNEGRVNNIQTNQKVAKIQPVQFTGTFGKAKRFSNVFPTKAGLQGEVLKGKNGRKGIEKEIQATKQVINLGIVRSNQIPPNATQQQITEQLEAAYMQKVIRMEYHVDVDTEGDLKKGIAANPEAYANKAAYTEVTKSGSC